MGEGVSDAHLSLQSARLSMESTIARPSISTLWSLSPAAFGSADNEDSVKLYAAVFGRVAPIYQQSVAVGNQPERQRSGGQRTVTNSADYWPGRRWHR